MDDTIDAILGFVRWLCRKLNPDQLVLVVSIQLEVANDQREDIRSHDDFREKMPAGSQRSRAHPPFEP